MLTDTNLILELVKNKLDITFANEQEIMSLIDAKSFDEVINFPKSLSKIIVLTKEKKVLLLLMEMKLWNVV